MNEDPSAEQQRPQPGWVPEAPGRGHYVFPPGEQPYWVPMDPPPRPHPPVAGQAPAVAGGPPVFVQPQHLGPGNDSAVLSIVLGSISLGVLILSFGFASPLTLIGSGLATFFGQRGQDNVRSGKTTKHEDTAVAGFWVGITGVILSVLALLAWVAIIIFAASTGDWDIE